MLSKEQLSEYRSMLGNKTAQWHRAVPALLSHIDELESLLESSGTIKAKVGIMQVEIDAGDDRKFGTKDDEVKVSVAKRKRAGAKKKKASTKKK